MFTRSFSVLVLIFTFLSAATAGRRPNIVLLYSDDMVVKLDVLPTLLAVLRAPRQAAPSATPDGPRHVPCPSSVPPRCRARYRPSVDLLFTLHEPNR